MAAQAALRMRRAAAARAAAPPPSAASACATPPSRRPRVRRLLPGDVVGRAPPRRRAAAPRAALRHAAEYRGKFYALAGPSQLAAFLLRPTEALAGAVLPEVRPAAVVVEDAGATLELGGYCPVSLGVGPAGADYSARVASLRVGDRGCAVEYGGRTFCCADGAARDEMMAAPWKYADLVLPAKLPPKAARLAAQLLPARGFMEQSVQELLERGLVELCALKPKYPTLNTKESALKFLAVYLKAHNPTTKAKHLKHKYGARLHDFTESCTLADRLLAAKKGSVESQAAGATELERLAGWDDCKARDLADFLKWERNSHEGLCELRRGRQGRPRGTLAPATFHLAY